MALLTRRRDPATSGEDSPAEANAGATGTMLPNRRRPRSRVERGFVRLVATAGIVGIGVLLGAILVSDKVQGWITGLVIAAVSVVLAALLWSSRQL
jgi:hypothetical protein